MRTFLKDLITTGFTDNLKALENSESFFGKTGHNVTDEQLRTSFLNSEAKQVHDLLHQQTVRQRLESIDKNINTIKGIAVFFLVITLVSIALYAISVS